jgi:hypothetical protein
MLQQLLCSVQGSSGGHAHRAWVGADVVLFDVVVAVAAAVRGCALAGGLHFR